MGIYEPFIPLMRIARSLVDERTMATSASAGWRERWKAGRRAAGLEQRFHQDATTLTRALLLKSGGRDADPVRSAEELRSMFQAIKSAVQGPDPPDERTKAIDFTAERFISIYTKEASKGPLRRHMEHFGALYAILLVTLVALDVEVPW